MKEREKLANELGAAGEYSEDWKTAEIEDLRSRVAKLTDNTKCPNGHKPDHDPDLDDMPCCFTCDMVATAWNTRTGEAHDWIDREEYEENVREMNRQMDDAFDNTYFNSGW